MGGHVPRTVLAAGRACASRLVRRAGHGCARDAPPTLLASPGAHRSGALVSRAARRARDRPGAGGHARVADRRWDDGDRPGAVHAPGIREPGAGGARDVRVDRAGPPREPAGRRPARPPWTDAPHRPGPVGGGVRALAHREPRHGRRADGTAAGPDRLRVLDHRTSEPDRATQPVPGHRAEAPLGACQRDRRERLRRGDAHRAARRRGARPVPRRTDRAGPHRARVRARRLHPSPRARPADRDGHLAGAWSGTRGTGSSTWSAIARC